MFIGVVGDTAVGVIRRHDEPLSKTLVATDGSIIARYLYLPDKDRWGFPWIIQDFKPGDEEPFRGDRADTLSADLTSAQEAVLLRTERASHRILDGISVQAGELVLLIPDEQGFVTEMRVLPNGATREYTSM